MEHGANFLSSSIAVPNVDRQARRIFGLILNCPVRTCYVKGMEQAPYQQDLFEEEFERPRIFRCIGGAFIGTFNRLAVADEGEPVRRLSTFFPSEQAAQGALDSGAWPPPGAELL